MQGYRPGDAMKRLREELTKEEFLDQAALYWEEHPDESRELFCNEHWVPFVNQLSVPKKIRKLLLKYRSLPIVDDVLQGWVVFEMVTTNGIPLDVVEEISLTEGLTLDVADFERRMEEFREKSRDGKKPGLQEWSEEKDV